MTAVPILLVTGYLGAGKTSVVNHLLLNSDGRRIAAIVNDFGEINIDADLLANVGENVVSLKNGCICCSLQGDLLSALKDVLRPYSPPDAIVIEASGVSDPTEIVRILLDPVIAIEAALDTVLCVVDARYLSDRPELKTDDLFQFQMQAADFIAVNKVDLVDADELSDVRSYLTVAKTTRRIFEVSEGRIASNVLFSDNLDRARSIPDHRAVSADDLFRSVSWVSKKPLSFPIFQAAIENISKNIVRAKGFIHFIEKPALTIDFQMVGKRATLTPRSSKSEEHNTTKIVIIADRGPMDIQELLSVLDSSIYQDQ